MAQTPDIGRTVSEGYQRGLDRMSSWLPGLLVIAVVTGLVGAVGEQVRSQLVPDVGDIFNAALRGETTSVDDGDLRTANLISAVVGAFNMLVGWGLYCLYGGLLHRERHGGETDVPTPGTVIPRLIAAIGSMMPKVGLLVGLFLASQAVGAVLGVLGGLVAFGVLIWFLYVVIRWVYAPVIAGGGEGDGDAAFEKSESVVDGAWWRTFGCFIVIGIATLAPAGILGLIITAVVPGVFLGALCGSVAATVFGMPIISSALESAWAQVEGGAPGGPGDPTSSFGEPAAPPAPAEPPAPEPPASAGSDEDARGPFV